MANGNDGIFALLGSQHLADQPSETIREAYAASQQGSAAMLPKPRPFAHALAEYIRNTKTGEIARQQRCMRLCARLGSVNEASFQTA